MTDVPDDTAHSAARVVFVVRVVLYSALAAIAIALIAARTGDSPDKPMVGTTSQDAGFSMELDREGRAVRFDTQLFSRCPNGTSWPVRWWEVDSPRVPFRRDGDRLRVEVDTGYFTVARGDVARQQFSLDARVTDDRAGGVLSFTERVDPITGGDYECGSGPVRFTVRR